MVGDHMGILGAVVLFTFYLFSYLLILFYLYLFFLTFTFFSYLLILFFFFFPSRPTFLVGGPLVTRTRTARLSTAAASEVHQKFAKSP
jgi:hypothetical protein